MDSSLDIANLNIVNFAIYWTKPSSHFKDLLSILQLIYETFDIVNKKGLTDFFVILRFECTFSVPTYIKNISVFWIRLKKTLIFCPSSRFFLHFDTNSSKRRESGGTSNSQQHGGGLARWHPPYLSYFIGWALRILLGQEKQLTEKKFLQPLN